MHEWKPCPGFEGLYEISNAGRVAHLEPDGSRRDVVTYQAATGTMVVGLWKGNIQTLKPVARLVYTAFIGAVPQGMVVTTKNDVPTDVRLSNVCVMSKSELGKRCKNGVRRVGINPRN